jgi:hypothetical protein
MFGTFISSTYTFSTYLQLFRNANGTFVLSTHDGYCRALYLPIVAIAFIVRFTVQNQIVFYQCPTCILRGVLICNVHASCHIASVLFAHDMPYDRNHIFIWPSYCSFNQLHRSYITVNCVLGLFSMERLSTHSFSGSTSTTDYLV